MTLYTAIWKPFFDLTITFIGLILLSPIFIVVWAILLYTNNLSPFFVQKRPGKKEKIINIIKFKSMTDKKDSNGNLLLDEERLTRFGKFIRKTSLDELPQLINVLKGEMSIVGPRPLRVHYLAYYSKRESLRHTVKPGITGLSQVAGRNDLGWDERLELDAIYAENISFTTDLKILFKTISKVLISSGSEVFLPESTGTFDQHRSKKIKK